MGLPALTSASHATAVQPFQPPGAKSPSQQGSTSRTQRLNPYPMSNLSRKRQPKEPPDPTVAWTSSIAVHCRTGRLSHAASMFTQMRLSGALPNHVTFLTLISGCADFPSQGKSFGPLIQAYARKLGLDTGNVMVATALVDMYAKCGDVESARLCFDGLLDKNSVSWNTMIDGYMKNGMVGDAIAVFDEMPKKDAVSWTVFIDGFVKMGHFEQALQWFREMLVSRVEPDYVTIIAILSACANLGALALGLWIHRYVLKKKFKNIKIGNTLIDMYSRSGCIELAHQVFDKMEKRTLVSWNSIIVGFAANGFAKEALEYFELMQKEGFEPNGVTFTGTLSACGHAGLVDEGLKHFDVMKRVYGISPRIEHCGCIVDLYSRAGRLEDAMRFVESMPMKPNEVVLGSLLASCRTHGDIGLAERLTGYLVDLDPGVDSNYVLLSNIYASFGMWDGANKVRRTMKTLGIQKKPGCTSIEIGCRIYEFVVGDKSHIETESIYAMLDLLSFDLKLCGYVPESTVRDAYEHD